MSNTDVLIIQDLVMEANIASVVRAIKIGTHLKRIKYSLSHGEWIPFMKENIGLSQRTCQNYMYLCKHVIHPKYYHYGIEGLMEMIRSGEDLSQ